MIRDDQGTGNVWCLSSHSIREHPPATLCVKLRAGPPDEPDGFHTLEKHHHSVSIPWKPAFVGRINRASRVREGGEGARLLSATSAPSVVSSHPKIRQSSGQSLGQSLRSGSSPPATWLRPHRGRVVANTATLQLSVIPKPGREGHPFPLCVSCELCGKESSSFLTPRKLVSKPWKSPSIPFPNLGNRPSLTGSTGRAASARAGRVPCSFQRLPRLP